MIDIIYMLLASVFGILWLLSGVLVEPIMEYFKNIIINTK